jgi:hypothetical protein
VKCTVEITETLQKGVEVEAESPDAAVRAVMGMYRNGDIVLCAVDHVDTAFDFCDNDKF